MVLLDTASPGGGAFIFDFEPSGINNGGQLALTASLTTVGVRRLWRRGQVSAPTVPRLDKRVLRRSPTHTALPVRFAAGAFSSSPTRTWRSLPRAHPRSSGRSTSRTRHAPCPLHVSRCPVSMVRLSRRSPATISPARTCGGRKFRWHGLLTGFGSSTSQIPMPRARWPRSCLLCQRVRYACAATTSVSMRAASST
jgi:hypothetical protein